MDLWIVIHWHRDGEDVYPVFAVSRPTADEQAAIVGESYEPEKEESLDVRGPWSFGQVVEMSQQIWPEAERQVG